MKANMVTVGMVNGHMKYNMATNHAYKSEVNVCAVPFQEDIELK